MKAFTPEGLIPDPRAHALALAETILKASEGYEVGTVRAHREQWAIVIAALKAYAAPSETGDIPKNLTERLKLMERIVKGCDGQSTRQIVMYTMDVLRSRPTNATPQRRVER